MKLEDELRIADARGVAPPQNWTTRAADELAALRNDADRYRKLVATGKFCALSTGGWGLSVGYGPRDSKDQLDAAADALPAQK